MTLKSYMNSKNILNKKSWVAVVFGVFFCGGIFGFIYETIFYIFNNGELTRRGTCFGPWINIYGYGALIIFILTYKLRKKPLLVFLLSGLSCGTLEFTVGYVIYATTGKRSWNYNTEILSFGNIEGFVCLRSVLVFASAGLFLMYFIVPMLMRLHAKIGEKKFFIICVTIGLLFLADIVYNDFLANNIGMPMAIEIWGLSGLYPIVTGFEG